MKLSKKIFLIVVIPAISISLIFGAIFLYSFDKVTRSRIGEEFKSISFLKSDELTKYIDSNEVQAIQISKNFKYILTDNIMSRNNSQSVSLDYQKIKEYLSGLMDMSDYDEIFIMNLDGMVLVSTDEMQEGKIKSNEDYFINGKNGSYSQQFYYDISLSKPSFTISEPIRGYEGTTIGVIAYRVKMEEISNIMEQRSGFGQTGESILINKYSTLISKSRFIEGIEFKKNIYTEGVKKCLNKESGFGEFLDYRGVMSLVRYQWVPEREVCMIVKMDSEEAMSPTFEMLKILLLSDFFAVCCVIFIGFFFSKSITRPIMVLRKASAEIGKGNLNTHIKYFGNDEIGELAKDFERMVRQLKKSKKDIYNYTKNLEKMVKLRTKDLEKKIDEIERFNRFATTRELRMIELKKKIAKLEKG
jgi:HAMP domain-containing protein